MSCSECIDLGYPNHKKGFKCNLTTRITDGWVLSDFYRKKVKITSLDGLYEHYVVFTNQQRDNYYSKNPGCPRVKKDSYFDFITHHKVGICPRSIITQNSTYWLELISYCDGEMGLNLPAKIEELPDLFFQALGIVRNVKGDLRKEEDSGPKKNSHSN